MLDFYLGTGGIESPGKHLGGLDMYASDWLQKNGFVMEGKYGHVPDDHPESLPYFDDVILSAKQVENIYRRFITRKNETKEQAGFNSIHVDTLEKILTEAKEEKLGMSTIAD
jgi:hypothetical protein